MKKLIALLTFSFVLLTSCNFEDSSEETSGGGLFSGAAPLANQFAASLPTSKTYAPSEHIDIVLAHASNVTVTNATPRLVLTIGAATQYADLISGSNTSTLTFRYTVQPGDQDNDGITISTTLDLNGATMTFSNEGVVTDVNTVLSIPNTSGILVGDPPPSVTDFIEPVNATYADGSNLLFQVNFSESVTVTGFPVIGIDIGGVTRNATYISGSTSAGLVFAYTVQAGEDDSDGIEVSSNSINLSSGNITSTANSSTALLDFSAFKNSTSSVIINTSSGITAPDQVATLSTAPTTSNTTLAVSWSVPADNNTTIIDYSLQYREKGLVSWTNISPSPTTNSTSVTGLVEGTTYEFRVAANNGLLGSFSNISEAEIFSIASLNPIAWLSATDITNGGTEPSNDDKVSSWSDLSGVASAATEGTPANQPTYKTNIQNGLPAVRFDAHSRGLEGTFTRVNNGGLTVFFVGKMDQNNSRKCFFEFYSTTATRRGFFFNYGFNEASTNYNLDDTGFNLWTAYDDGSNTDLWENGSSVYTDITNWGPTAFTGGGAYVLGDDATSGDQINGYIGEFLIFDQELTAAEKLKIENYLKNKWGTP